MSSKMILHATTLGFWQILKLCSIASCFYYNQLSVFQRDDGILANILINLLHMSLYPSSFLLYLVTSFSDMKYVSTSLTFVKWSPSTFNHSRMASCYCSTFILFGCLAEIATSLNSSCFSLG